MISFSERKGEWTVGEGRVDWSILYMITSMPTRCERENPNIWTNIAIITSPIIISIYTKNSF